MKTKANPAVLSRVEAALPLHGGITSQKLRESLDIRVTTSAIAIALRDLIAGDRATFDGEMGRRLYRKRETA